MINYNVTDIITTATSNRAGFTAIGRIRGCCGHVHRTEDAATACADRDHAGCAAHGGYSDRRVVTVVKA